MQIGVGSNGKTIFCINRINDLRGLCAYTWIQNTNLADDDSVRQDLAQCIGKRFIHALRLKKALS